MKLDDRLALAALRGVVQELEGNADGAGEVLARVLGGAATPAVAEHAETPKNTTRPAARRPKRKAASRRPAPAAKPRPPEPRRGVVDPDVPELVARLIERHGGTRAAASAIGSSAPMLRAWARGKPALPETIARLRAALEQGRAPEADDAGDEPAGGAGSAA
jgi:hypothetical protein